MVYSGSVPGVESRGLELVIESEVPVATSDDVAVADLVTAAAAGDQQAWAALVDRYSGLLWAVARSFRLSQADAGDVVQTSWLRLVEHLGRLREPERVGAWLATTARREALRTLRRSGRDTPTDEPYLLDAPDPSEAPVDSGLLTAERDRQLWRAVEALPDRCRHLLRVLMADPPPPYDEVSAALDMPIGSIGPTRQRCLERLRRGISADVAGSV